MSRTTKFPLGVAMLSDAFEEVPPDMTNMSEYTYESLVFSFSLIGAVGSLLADPEPELPLSAAVPQLP